jgi:alpha-tubulin suppressor-like RCC1 family protein
VTAGIDHSCAVLNDGSAFCWGENAEGQLGIDAAASEALSPRELPSSGSWRLLAAGQGHTCGIQRDGSLWCWGRNTSNHLGLGSGALQQIRAPVRVGTRADWASLDSSQEGSCAIGADARVSCWGNVFAAITNQGSAAVPTAVGSEQWAWFSVEVFHGCGVRDDRSLWCSGRNVEGQLGTGDNAERQTLTRIGMDTDWQSVSVGRFHTCARKTNGDVFCTGINDDGRLGTGDTNRRNTFTLTR